MQKEVERIYELTKSLNMVVIDCDVINHPSQLTDCSLAPISIYIKMEPQILEKLVKLRGSKRKNLGAQVVAAQKLAQCNEVSNSLKLYLQRNSFVTQRNRFVTQRYMFVTNPPHVRDTTLHVRNTTLYVRNTTLHVRHTTLHVRHTTLHVRHTTLYLTLCSHYTGQLCVPTCTTIRCSMNTYPICDSPLKRSARRSFTLLQISPPQKTLYVWTEALSDMVFVPVQKPSDLVWTLP